MTISEALNVDIKDLFNSTKETYSDTLHIKKDGELVAVWKLIRE